jgi:hypothetical protein
VKPHPDWPQGAGGGGLLEQLPADAAGGRENRELHLDFPS